MDEALLAHVQPFYRRMMRLNAPTADPAVIRGVRESSEAMTVDQVRDLLSADWRPRVMGAWYALAHEAETVKDALAASLRTSRGTLTAPPLATVALVVLSSGALPSLIAYAQAAAASPWLGSDGFVAAAIQRLGGQAQQVVPTPADFADLDRMLAVAKVLRQR